MSDKGSTRQLLLAGLPHTGKTSFLAVFFLAVDNMPGRLRLGSYADDREYLNTIAGRLMRCENAEHTHVDEHRELSLSLEIAESGMPVALRIPDLSGETWEAAVAQRWWPREVDEHVSKSEAILVFLHADQLDTGLTKGAEDTAAEVVGTPAITRTVSNEEDPEQRHVAVEGQSPTQVLLVDILQLTLEQRGPRPARACIMLSAWDTQPDGLTPDDYIANNLPLLSQYISSNTDWLSTRAYGVSAQGGDFGTAREELAERNPLERAFVLGGDGAELAIEDPVVWVLGRDG